MPFHYTRFRTEIQGNSPSERTGFENQALVVQTGGERQQRVGGRDRDWDFVERMLAQRLNERVELVLRPEGRRARIGDIAAGIDVLRNGIDAEQHVSLLAIERIQRRKAVIANEIELARVRKQPEHRAVVHIMTVNDQMLRLWNERMQLVEKQRAGGTGFAVEIVGKVIGIVPIDDGQADHARNAQPRDQIAVFRKERAHFGANFLGNQLVFRLQRRNRLDGRFRRGFGC